jgi:alkylation response protein AidB-like acyl-CoA dehydrogenase
VGQGAIDLAMDYAARRETMGEPLLAHQGLQFKLAGMEADVAAARALTFQAATFVDEGANRDPAPRHRPPDGQAAAGPRADLAGDHARRAGGRGRRGRVLNGSGPGRAAGGACQEMEPAGDAPPESQEVLSGRRAP